MPESFGKSANSGDISPNNNNNNNNNSIIYSIEERCRVESRVYLRDNSHININLLIFSVMTMILEYSLFISHIRYVILSYTIYNTLLSTLHSTLFYATKKMSSFYLKYDSIENQFHWDLWRFLSILVYSLMYIVEDKVNCREIFNKYYEN